MYLKSDREILNFLERNLFKSVANSPSNWSLEVVFNRQCHDFPLNFPRAIRRRAETRIPICNSIELNRLAKHCSRTQSRLLSWILGPQCLFCDFISLIIYLLVIAVVISVQKRAFNCNEDT